MAAWTGQPNTVSLVWTPNLRRVYYRNQRLGVEFGPNSSESSAGRVNTYVIVKGNRTCPGGTGQNRPIIIPGTMQYHAYSSNNLGSLRNGKLLRPNSTWAQLGVGRGLWYITCTFTPTQCWRNTGIRITRMISPPIWICNPCNNPWPIPCSC